MAVEAKAMEVGFNLPTVVKEISAEKMYVYSGRHGDFNKKSIHTDREVAAKIGFPDVVCQGTMILNYISEMLFKVYREHWIQNSKINVAFVGTVFPGEVLSTKGVVTGKDTVDSGTHLKLDVWMENKEGERVAVGNAEVAITP